MEKIEYDKDVDAMYIYFIGKRDKLVSVPLIIDELDNSQIILDFNNGSELTGIEVLDASKIFDIEEVVNSPNSLLKNTSSFNVNYQFSVNNKIKNLYLFISKEKIKNLNII